MLKFKKILGYYPTGSVVFLLEDGRYAMTNVHQYSNIPENYEDKIKKILNNPNTKLRFEYVGGPITGPITVKEYLNDLNTKEKEL